MSKKKFNNQEIKILIISAIIFVIGVLFCFSLAMGTNGVSLLIGISMIVVGIMFVVNSVARDKSFVTSTGLSGAAVVAFGLMFCARSMAGLIFDYLPYLLIVVGVCFVADAFLKRINNNQLNVLSFVVELLFGCVVLAFGVCLKFVNGFSDYASLVLGAILIVYAVVSACKVLLKSNKSKDTQ